MPALINDLFFFLILSQGELRTLLCVLTALITELVLGFNDHVGATEARLNYGVFFRAIKTSGSMRRSQQSRAGI